MSTKKKTAVKHDQLKKNEKEFKTIKPSEKKSLTKIAKQVAANHKDDRKPTLLMKKSDITKGPIIQKKDKFHIWDVYGVKYFLDDNHVPTRRTSCVEVTSDHDTANEPELRNRLIGEAEAELTSKGFFLTDADAMEDAIRRIEPVLDKLRHDIKYGDACQKCAAERVNVITDWLEYLRSWRERRYELADTLGGESRLPSVIPNDYRENWHIDMEKRALVPNVEKPKVTHSVIIAGNGTKDLIKVLEKLNIPKETIAEIEQSVKAVETTAPKALPAPKKIAQKK